MCAPRPFDGIRFKATGENDTLSRRYVTNSARLKPNRAPHRAKARCDIGRDRNRCPLSRGQRHRELGRGENASARLHEAGG
jgi:hypothetical protein